MQGGNTGNGFDKDSKRASEAGKKGGSARGLKAIIKDVLNEKLPESTYEEIRTKLGLTENIPQGEAAVKMIIDKMVSSGDVRSLVEILKITGEYTEKIDVNNTIIYLDEQDKDL